MWTRAGVHGPAHVCIRRVHGPAHMCTALHMCASGACTCVHPNRCSDVDRGGVAYHGPADPRARRLRFGYFRPSGGHSARIRPGAGMYLRARGCTCVHAGAHVCTGGSSRVHMCAPGGRGPRAHVCTGGVHIRTPLDPPRPAPVWGVAPVPRESSRHPLTGRTSARPTARLRHRGAAGEAVETTVLDLSSTQYRGMPGLDAAIAPRRC